MWLILTCLFSFSCVSFLTNETPEACKRKEQDPSKDRSNTPKKSRLVFTDLQRRTLLAIFKENKRPSKEMQLTISQQLGLELNTVSNFFMNARRRSLDKWLDEGSPGNTSSTSSTCTKAWSRGEGGGGVGWDGMGTWDRDEGPVHRGGCKLFKRRKSFWRATREEKLLTGSMLTVGNTNPKSETSGNKILLSLLRFEARIIHQEWKIKANQKHC